MKPQLLAIVLGGSVIAACFVERPSAVFECNDQSDCSDGRTCTDGYCVVSNCPDDCTSCNEGAKTCLVTCTSADECFGTIDCPSGWTCTITCTGDGACRDVRCASGSKCDITCTGSNACDDIYCSNACGCDLTCIGTACSSWSCPTANNGNECTTDGTVDTPCDSSRTGSCTKC
ncbi:MAG: hypothetical protein HOV81_16775 [Kofleriaceae bacterium]|nr:hypothetical protein [Kofleriaceae bacterium]